MKRPITVERMVLHNGEPVPVIALSRKEKADLARWLKQTWFTELYRGQAEVIWEEKAEKDPAI